MVVLVRIAAAGRGLLYTFTSFSGQSDFASQKSCICAVTHVTKSACSSASGNGLSGMVTAPFQRQPEAKV